ncbi:helix-turn-helix domain-containing protein [Peptoniphilus stercorisuis]|uniref:Two-component system response regulator YesN n=1 Tax=Peptoniphilus stercorisuis TaxID=1436965 RepID=A0ABS4KBT4_9FIRM|nr:AraC family transcriptional regulator [Peptoniphilus stercorisuis]MBP2025237.1 two-component system response regulator YesN [Peptoniphilus stercorisuis]
MLNHLALANLTRPNTISKAIDIYHKDIFKYVSNKKNMKDFLKSLNIFLYTYFLMKYNKDLETFALKNNEYINKEDNFDNLLYFGEKIVRGYSNKFTSVLKQNDHELIEDALEYINNNFNKKLTLQGVANKLHISRNYLCHLFKVQTGYKFCEYINLQRVNRAKELIEENKKTLEFISFDCGFSSQSHFSTTFKKYVGLTPNEYKKTLIYN